MRPAADAPNIGRSILARRSAAGWILSAGLATWLAAGCGGPWVRADDVAAAAGFAGTTLRGASFDHVAYSVDGGDAHAPVWVYLEGDGVPWINELIPAEDPTPRILVGLGMMAEGPRPAIYLGRPCYFAVRRSAGCEPIWWTHRRFSPEVVGSMVAALHRLIDERGWAGRRLNLVGFSGGGTLAALMARRLDTLCALVTLASPLDVDEWTASRGFSPLAGSENPALLPPLPPAVRQLHLRGENDRIVAPDNGGAFRRRNPAAAFRVVDVEHGGGWVAIWRGLVHEKADAAIAGCL